MNSSDIISDSFSKGLKTLGFESDDVLFLVEEDYSLLDPQIRFHLEVAHSFGAAAVYLRLQLNGSYRPQVYLFDYTDESFHDENEVAEIQKKIWSSGEAPLACVFYKTEIKIVDCTKHLTKDYKPEYLIKDLQLTGKVHKIYNTQFAIKIKTGVFWEQEELKNKFKFQNSAYDTLIKNIRFVVKRLKKEFNETSFEVINKIIIQSILIKYLEERIDGKGNKLLSNKYFQKYDNATTFNDVLKQEGSFVELLNDLNRDFNGNVFKWTEEEQSQLKSLNLKIVSDLLATNKADIETAQLELSFPDWRYFEFKFIPVELISRLYEEFLGEDKQENGLFYTPSHLAKLLIDECLPLRKYKDINLQSFEILDPACGSGIFLVISFKRLVQIWRLQNDMKFPDIDDLKPILRNIYGVDKEEQAIRLASFSLSLALCNELNPVKIINELKFDDLREYNLIYSDFFRCNQIKDRSFDLVVGNPPFVRGGISNYDNSWIIDNKKVKIPQGQIALKFLSHSFDYLKKGGLVCLIIKSSGLLYNSTSEAYKKALFSNYNVIQVVDFTALARNKSLWDNGADVASAAIFIKNEKPDFNKNILHLTLRRTKGTKERIVFEIDEYDLHFISRKTAINNNFIWKHNLLGGGRIKSLVEKVQGIHTFEDFLTENNCTAEEGLIGSKGKLFPEFLKKIPFLPTEAISERGIDYNQLIPLPSDVTFIKAPKEKLFTAPNIIIWENVGEKHLPVFYNEKDFSFRHQIVGIASDSTTLLKQIITSFKKFNDFYRFYMFVTSSYLLINRNTSLLKNDYMNIPFIIDGNSEDIFSEFDLNIMSDVNHHLQSLIRNENSITLRPIKQFHLYTVISSYGKEFCRALNVVYEKNLRRFRLSNIITLENSLIAVVFKYDSNTEPSLMHEDLSELHIDGLTNNEISSHLTVKRVIKLYPQKDTIVLIKPNQLRYWLSLIAYRDADKCFSELSNVI